jgi:hypothetical protein
MGATTSPRLILYGIHVPAAQYRRIKIIADALWPLLPANVPESTAKRLAAATALRTLQEFQTIERCRKD